MKLGILHRFANPITELKNSLSNKPIILNFNLNRLKALNFLVL